MENFKHTQLTEQVINGFYKVYNKLGYGFLENVYENALLIELQRMNMLVERQKRITVFYEGYPIGNYYADIVVNQAIILELKAADSLCKEHENQLINYLKATDMEVGLLLNFGKRPEFKRKVFSNRYK